MRVRCLEEEEPLGTAGAIRLIDPLTDPFLVVNGDVLTSASFGEIAAAHRRTGAAITLGTRTLQHATGLGVVRRGADGVVALDEKPLIPYEVAAGVYVLARGMKDLVPKGHFDMPELVNAALAQGLPVQAHELVGFWMDVGTPERYQAAVCEFPGFDAHAGV
jgi:NDP-sugar pyrophosphorylase family protein